MLLRAERSVTVDRDVEDVFDYLAHGENNVQWRDGVLEIERTSVVTGEGATYRQVMKGPAGRAIRGDYRVTRHERPEVLEFSVTAGPARPKGRFHLERAADGGTTVTSALELDPRGPSRLFASLVRKQMEREVAALEELRRQLDNS